ncbi:MAG: glycosyltransferase family 2 protein [Pirellulales bacterium]
MPRISCIVPVLDRVQAMEPTLVSLLENRPRNAEILLVFTGPYDDPYQLKDEVRFLRAPAESDLLAAINTGIVEAQSPVVHVLDVGATAVPGWADAALECFRDSRVAAVAPALCEPTVHGAVHTLGWSYTPQSGPQRMSAELRETLSFAGEPKVVAPTIRAGFYRTMALELLGGKFPTVCGDEWSTVDLCLMLDAVGYTTATCRESLVAIPSEQVPLATTSTYRTGACLERLYARNLDRVGAFERYMGHAVGMLGELASGVVKPATLLRACGRLSAWTRGGEWKNHRIAMTETRAVCDSMFAQIRETQAKVEKSRSALRGIEGMG